MHEPEFFNNTAFASAPFPLLDAEGRDSRVVIAKATYAVHGFQVLADEQRPIRGGDEMWEAPEIADIKYPGDLCCYKPGTDVVLVGHVEADPSMRAEFLDIGISISKIEQRLRVYGDRFWDDCGLGCQLTPASPLERVPLAWSRTWGGFDDSDPSSLVEEPRNPVGRGVVRYRRDLIGKPAPQIELLHAPITEPTRKNMPAGCAPLGRHFEPRRGWAGTYDDHWLNHVYPAKPSNYDPRHENVAAPGMLLSDPPKPGEILEVTGLRSGEILQFAIPKVRVVIEATIDGQTIARRPHLDTLLFDGDAQVVELTWRGAFRCPPKMRNRFTEIQVHSKEIV